MFYSMTYDLSHSLQHNFLKSKDSDTETVIDTRYLFNEFLLSFFTAASERNAAISKWKTSVICGFAGLIEMDYKEGEKVSLA